MSKIESRPEAVVGEREVIRERTVSSEHTVGRGLGE